ncbi:hypothetical protein EBN03_10820 [Nocardia stercoris]|uniref:Uncharacterized protein n=1 Tax=Nocardia stercoris TaxID=2483361 RepID=A0A3M2L7R0_9NOCA|nr:hypothetical protein EBN03_10820 [Nocardia stercoris]
MIGRHVDCDQVWRNFMSKAPLHRRPPVSRIRFIHLNHTMSLLIQPHYPNNRFPAGGICHGGDLSSDFIGWQPHSFCFNVVVFDFPFACNDMIDDVDNTRLNLHLDHGRTLLPLAPT